MRFRRRCTHDWVLLGYGFMGHAYLWCSRCHKDRVTARYDGGGSDA